MSFSARSWMHCHHLSASANTRCNLTVLMFEYLPHGTQSIQAYQLSFGFCFLSLFLFLSSPLLYLPYSILCLYHFLLFFFIFIATQRNRCDSQSLSLLSVVSVHLNPYAIRCWTNWYSSFNVLSMSLHVSLGFVSIFNDTRAHSLHRLYGTRNAIQ